MGLHSFQPIPKLLQNSFQEVGQGSLSQYASDPVPGLHVAPQMRASSLVSPSVLSCSPPQQAACVQAPLYHFSRSSVTTGRHGHTPLLDQPFTLLYLLCSCKFSTDTLRWLFRGFLSPFKSRHLCGFNPAPPRPPPPVSSPSPVSSLPTLSSSNILA